MVSKEPLAIREPVVAGARILQRAFGPPGPPRRDAFGFRGEASIGVAAAEDRRGGAPRLRPRLRRDRPSSCQRYRRRRARDLAVRRAQSLETVETPIPQAPSSKSRELLWASLPTVAISGTMLSVIETSNFPQAPSANPSPASESVKFAIDLGVAVIGTSTS